MTEKTTNIGQHNFWNTFTLNTHNHYSLRSHESIQSLEKQDEKFHMQHHAQTHGKEVTRSLYMSSRSPCGCWRVRCVNILIYFHFHFTILYVQFYSTSAFHMAKATDSKTVAVKSSLYSIVTVQVEGAQQLSPPAYCGSCSNVLTTATSKTDQYASDPILLVSVEGSQKKSTFHLDYIITTAVSVMSPEPHLKHMMSLKV